MRRERREDVWVGEREAVKIRERAAEMTSAGMEEWEDSG